MGGASLQRVQAAVTAGFSRSSSCFFLFARKRRLFHQLAVCCCCLLVAPPRTINLVTDCRGLEVFFQLMCSCGGVLMLRLQTFGSVIFFPLYHRDDPAHRLAARKHQAAPPPPTPSPIAGPKNGSCCCWRPPEECGRSSEPQLGFFRSLTPARPAAQRELLRTSWRRPPPPAPPHPLGSPTHTCCSAPVLLSSVDLESFFFFVLYLVFFSYPFCLFIFSRFVCFAQKNQASGSS